MMMLPTSQVETVICPMRGRPPGLAPITIFIPVPVHLYGEVVSGL